MYGDLLNQKNQMDGIELMKNIPDNTIKLTFFDPQYRGVMDKLQYGNPKRMKGRLALPQMTDEIIINFIKEIDRVSLPSSHLMLWVDKFHLVEGIHKWIVNTNLTIVDMITWDKGKIGMGYRTRRKSEYLVILQKLPKRAKGCWTLHDIPDVWSEKIKIVHPHSKPIGLLRKLILATTTHDDVILDPASGGWSVLSCCMRMNRNFIGADLIIPDKQGDPTAYFDRTRFLNDPKNENNIAVVDMKNENIVV